MPGLQNGFIVLHVLPMLMRDLQGPSIFDLAFTREIYLIDV